MRIRALLGLILACGLLGCSSGETENTLPPDPNAEPKVTPPAKKKGNKPATAPRSEGMPIQ